MRNTACHIKANMPCQIQAELQRGSQHLFSSARVSGFSAAANQGLPSVKQLACYAGMPCCHGMYNFQFETCDTVSRRGILVAMQSHMPDMHLGSGCRGYKFLFNNLLLPGKLIIPFSRPHLASSPVLLALAQHHQPCLQQLRLISVVRLLPPFL